ncbi:MAG: hypothetical protein EPN50_03900 [Chloroflexota bacterium]|nr:MAG: hypothetical protein EPN50_03900 [Chloroflexota bacterium]
MMICGSLSLVAIQGSDAAVHALRCKTWACSRCGPGKVRATIARVRKGMAAGGTVRFFTLTSPGTEDSPTSYAALPHRWKLFMLRVNRRFGRIEYLAVVEPQRRGAAHLHVVYRGQYIPQRWLARTAEESGFGRIADIRRPPRTIATYLAKYLAKDLTSSTVKIPKYFRRVRWSRAWCDWQRPTRQTDGSTTWYLVNGNTEVAAASATRRGYHVVAITGNPARAPNRPRRPIWRLLSRATSPCSATGAA